MKFQKKQEVDEQLPGMVVGPDWERAKESWGNRNRPCFKCSGGYMGI